MAIRLEVRHGEVLEKAIKRFKKMCDREGLSRDIRRNSYFEKPSEKNKRKLREREKEMAKQVRLAAKRARQRRR